jgi:hypothetical protein
MELAVVLPHDGVGMRSRLDANQVLLLLANCARSIEHSRARGFNGLLIESWRESCMECRSREGQGMVRRYVRTDRSFLCCLFYYFTRGLVHGATADGQGCAKERREGASEQSGRRVVGIIFGKGVPEGHLVPKWFCRVRCTEFW